jgi:hypothetical protein
MGQSACIRLRTLYLFADKYSSCVALGEVVRRIGWAMDSGTILTVLDWVDATSPMEATSNTWSPLSVQRLQGVGA